MARLLWKLHADNVVKESDKFNNTSPVKFPTIPARTPVKEILGSNGSPLMHSHITEFMRVTPEWEM